MDGTGLVGLTGYALISLRSVYPHLRDVIDSSLNDAGRAMVATTATQCTIDILLQYGFQHTTSFTVTGRSIVDELSRYPESREVLGDNRIGERTPTTPVLVESGTSDDAVPHGDSVDLVDK